jgi:hypothetical protein
MEKKRDEIRNNGIVDNVHNTGISKGQFRLSWKIAKDKFRLSWKMAKDKFRLSWKMAKDKFRLSWKMATTAWF